MPVTIEDATREAARLRRLPPGKKKPRTMAHAAAIRFYRKHLRENRTGPSLVERAAALESRVAAEEFLTEIDGMKLKPKKLAQVRRTVLVRVGDLK